MKKIALVALFAFIVTSIIPPRIVYAGGRDGAGGPVAWAVVGGILAILTLGAWSNNNKALDVRKEAINKEYEAQSEFTRTTAALAGQTFGDDGGNSVVNHTPGSTSITYTPGSRVAAATVPETIAPTTTATLRSSGTHPHAVLVRPLPTGVLSAVDKLLPNVRAYGGSAREWEALFRLYRDVNGERYFRIVSGNDDLQIVRGYLAYNADKIPKGDLLALQTFVNSF